LGDEWADVSLAYVKQPYHSATLVEVDRFACHGRSVPCSDRHSSKSRDLPIAAFAFAAANAHSRAPVLG
jgi:hypothetical protein